MSTYDPYLDGLKRDAKKFESMLTTDERAGYELLGRARVVIEWLLDNPGAIATNAAREWLNRYEQSMGRASK